MSSNWDERHYSKEPREMRLAKLHSPKHVNPPKALTVNTSTPGNDLAATRMEEVEKRVLALEFEVSLLKGGNK